MTEQPVPPVFTLSWLAPDSVKAWLRLADDEDDDLIIEICGDVEAYVQQVRPELVVDDTGTYSPDAQVYRGAVMLAAREYRRRNSPAGIEAFGDAGTSFVARFDPDIQRLLQTGAYAPPTIA